MKNPDPKLRALLDLRRGTSLIARFSQGALRTVRFAAQMQHRRVRDLGAK